MAVRSAVRTDAAPFAADGIEVSKDGAWVHWQALAGRTLYRVASDALDGNGAADRSRQPPGSPCQTAIGSMSAAAIYVSAVEENAVCEPSGEVYDLV